MSPAQKLCLEYELYGWGIDNQSFWAGDIFADYLMARDPGFFLNLPWHRQFELVMLTPFKRVERGVLNKLRPHRPVPPVRSSVYDPELLDEHGDRTGHTQARIPAGVDPVFPLCKVLADGLSPDASGFPAIREFCNWAVTNHVRVLATFPNLCDRQEYHRTSARQAIDTITRFYAALNVPVIGSADEALLPRSAFFNTAYHPTVEAAEIRTDQLISKLRRQGLMGMPSTSQ